MPKQTPSQPAAQSLWKLFAALGDIINREDLRIPRLGPCQRVTICEVRRYARSQDRTVFAAPLGPTPTARLLNCGLESAAVVFLRGTLGPRTRHEEHPRLVFFRLDTLLKVADDMAPHCWPTRMWFAI